MTNPTSNFNWQMPTASDLVTDLPADFETFGQAVDTSLADLKGGTTGQVLSKASNTDMDFTWVASDDTNAIQNAIVDAKGDLIAASAADTPARLAVGNNGETLVADSSTSTGLSYQANWAAGKNKIINGDCTINQRNFSSQAVTAEAAVFIVDRFTGTNVVGGTSTFSVQPFTLGTAPVAGYEATQFIRAVSSGQSAGFAGTIFTQNIENVRTFAGQTITVSFWAKAASGTPNVSIELAQAFGTGGSPSTRVEAAGGAQKFAISTSWVRYSKTITLPSIAGKTLGTNNNSRLEVNIWVSAGTDFNSRTNSLGIQSNTFDIWGVQVEAGSVATAFQTATGTIQGELDSCMRYAINLNYNPAGKSSYNTIANGYASSTTAARIAVNLPVAMRTQPSSITTSGNFGLDNISSVPAVTSITINQGGTTTVLLAVNVASGLTSGQNLTLYSNNDVNANIILSAEL
jgi:hypothetical protein